MSIRRPIIRALALALVIACVVGGIVASHIASGHVNALRSYAPSDGRRVIVCLGDSLTAGDAAPPDQSYPAWLQRRLDGAGYRYRVVNAGVSGDRVVDGLARLQRDVLSQHPAVVIVELGSNDPGRTPRVRWASELATIVSRLQARGARVILGGLDEPGMGDVYRAVAARYQTPLVWFTADLWSRPGLWGDAHHPSGAGYRVVAESFWPAVHAAVISMPRARKTGSASTTLP